MTPLPPFPSMSNILLPPWPWKSNFKQVPPPTPPNPYFSPNHNEFIERKHNLRMTIICHQVLPSGRLSFSVSTDYLLWLSFDFLSFSWSLTTSFFIAFYSCVSKTITECLKFIVFTFSVLILQSTCFICTAWSRKQSMDNNDTCEWTKSKQKENHVTSHSNWPRVLLLDLAFEKCNGIIKRFHHFLTSESEEGFLLNTILIPGPAWCLVITSRTLTNPNFPTSHKVSFLPDAHPHLLPPPLAPLKVDVTRVSLRIIDNDKGIKL